VTQVGSIPISLRGDVAWRGMTTLTLGERGDRRFQLLENAYVSSDGSEIRTFPGWKCVVDFRTTQGTNGSGVGFDRLTTDVARAVSFLPAAGNYYENVTPYTSTAVTEALTCFARPTHIHGFKFVRGQTVFYGESDFRKEIIYDTGGTPAAVTISAVTVGVNTTLTFNANFRATVGSFNGLEFTTTDPQVVYIEGLTGANASLLNGKFHLAISTPAANQVVLETDTSSSTNTSSQTGYIYRVCPGTTAPGNSADTYYSTSLGTRACDDVESLTTWSIHSQPSVTALMHTGSSVGAYSAWVANRMRDCGDLTIAGGGVRYEGYVGTGVGRRRRKRLPYRLVPDVAGERLLLAAPGYGCVFQAPRLTTVDPVADTTGTPSTDGFPYRNNDIYDKPRCVGVPKAVMWVDYDTAEASTYHLDRSGATTGNDFGGSDATVSARNGTYRIMVAYRDEATGEIGLPSEPVAITTGTTNAFQAIRIRVLHPGYLMGETMALSIVVFRTERNGSTYYKCSVSNAGVQQSLRYGLQPATGLGTGGTYFQYVDLEVPYFADEVLRKDTTPVPVIEQMPMGAKAVRTVRNHTFYGGQLGNAGLRRELFQSSATTEYTGTSGNYPNYNEITFRTRTGITNWHPSDGFWMCADGHLPPAYANQVDLAGPKLYPFPTFLVGISKLVNTTTQWDSGLPTTFNVAASYIRYQLIYTPLVSTLSRSGSWEGMNCWAVLPRGLFQVSEANAPGVVDSHSNFVDAQKEEDIEGIGHFDGAVVFCTRSNTYIYNWSQSPFTDGVSPALPDQVSADFGCIAPNSMVDFDGGCAWISDRGPVAVTANGVEWIGRELERYFVGSTARYKRDSEGMMRHSWACHDAERGLVYFGMFADRESATANRVTVSYRGETYNWSTANPTGTFSADEAKSRFPCDEVLVWSYRNNAWSRWVPPTGLEVFWMERGYDSSGAQRVFFLARDWRLYALDDAYTDANADVLTLTATNAGSSSTALTVTAASFAATEAAVDAGTFLRVGTGVLIKSSDGTVKAYSTISAATAATGSITLSSSCSWAYGDTVYIGVRQATLTSNWFNLTGSENTATARAVSVRYNLWGNNTATAALQAYAAVNKRVESSRTYASMPLHGEKVAEWLGSDEIGTPVGRSIKLAKGIASGQEIQVGLTIYHAGQVRLSDVVMEAP